MPTLTIDLPEDLGRDVNARAAAGGYQRVEDYLLDFIAAGSGEPISAELEARLVRAAQLPTREFTAADWDEQRRRLREWHAGLRK